MRIGTVVDVAVDVACAVIGFGSAVLFVTLAWACSGLLPQFLYSVVGLFLVAFTAHHHILPWIKTAHP